MFDERSWIKFLQVCLHLGSWFVPSLEAFIVQTSGQEHPHWYSIDLLAIVYYIGKLVCSSGCVLRMLLEQIFGSSFPPRKFNGTKHGGAYCSKNQPGASSLIINWFTIAALAIAYWISKLVCSSGCVRRTLLKQIFASSSSHWKLTGTNLGGVHPTNIWTGPSSLIFNWFIRYR